MWKERPSAGNAGDREGVLAGANVTVFGPLLSELFYSCCSPHQPKPRPYINAHEEDGKMNKGEERHQGHGCSVKDEWKQVEG